jgi:hypothetical protein
MPKLGNQVKNQPFGTVNNFGLARKVPTPVQLIKGPAQGIEPLVGMPPEQARAFQAIQKNITAATQQSGSNPAAFGKLQQGVTLSNCPPNGATPNIIAHGLSQPFTGYQIHAVYGGYVTAHTLIPNSNSKLDELQIQIWTQVTAFPGQTVMADIMCY